MKEKFLEKLCLNQEAPTLKFLSKLIDTYTKKISFNNVFVLLDRSKLLPLDLDSLEEKVLERGNGGYCFENNKVLAAVLTEMGYEVHSQLSRVLYGKTGDSPRTHQVLIVVIDGSEYIVDVGFGPYSPNFPVPLGKREGSHWALEDEHGNIHLSMDKKGEDFVLYQLDRAQYRESDFKLSHFYSSFYPEAKFVTSFVCSIKKEGGFSLINNNIYTRMLNDNREDLEIENSIHLKELLSTEMNIDLSVDESNTLWNTISEFIK